MNYRQSAIVIALLLPVAVFGQEFQTSVVTVNELLKIDNAQAIQKAQEEAMKTGLLQGPKGATQKLEAPLPVWSVRSIYGLGVAKYAELRVDSTSLQPAQAGQDVAMCHIEAIKNECVALSPKSKKTRKGSCPEKVCWTGSEIAMESRPDLSKTATTGFRIAPTPLPTAAMPLPQGSGGATSGSGVQ